MALTRKNLADNHSGLQEMAFTLHARNTVLKFVWFKCLSPRVHASALLTAAT